MKGGAGGAWGYWKSNKWPSPSFISSPVFLGLCVSFSVFALPSPSFPLTHPLMVIYLVGKGFAFSPNRSTTGREQESSGLGKEREEREGAGRNGRKEQKIYHSRRSPRWHLLSLPLTLTAVMEVKAWPQTERGEKKRITCQYLFPLAAWIETDTLHSLSLFPLKPIQELYLCLGSRGLRGSPGRKQTWQDSEWDNQRKVWVEGKEGERMTNTDKQWF